ncbi:MAG TPA: class I SAM-dependent methyltransferase [Candidatus Aminicenantes bacterium]|nr:class I SAM-dependent methyltransferase [Candidatus Aminicenantes bacterium]
MKTKSATTGSGENAAGREEEMLKRIERRREQYRAYGYDTDRERDWMIERALPLGALTLETGTGKGHFTLALARRGFRVTTVDASEEEQAFARLQAERSGLAGLIEFRVGDAESLDFPDDSFDAVFSVNLLHHLSDPRRALDEMARVLAPGGKLVVSDFSDEGFRMMDELHRSEGGRHRASPFGVEDAGRHLRGKGFAVETSRTRFQVMLTARRA